VVRANREFEIAVGFVEHEGHPKRHESCGHPGVVVGVVWRSHVDDSDFVKLAKTPAI
jgi:hypothetical protein